MKTYTFTTGQKLPITLQKAWDFFSSPYNLNIITPEEMRFTITSNFPPEQKMYPGILISYTLKPLAGIKMNWLTEITHIQEGKYFIDEQRFGPYTLWHHQHHFEEIEGGVFMKDILTYAIPYGIIGKAMNQILVRKKIEKIFEFREMKIEELFGQYS